MPAQAGERGGAPPLAAAGTSGWVGQAATSGTSDAPVKTGAPAKTDTPAKTDAAAKTKVSKAEPESGGSGSETKAGASTGSAAPPAGAAGSGAGAAAGVGALRFAQITDAHLFDAGYNCSGSFVEREFQESQAALNWSITEILRRGNSGAPIEFLVFTGDLGLANLEGGEERKPGRKDPACSDGEVGGVDGPIKSLSYETAESMLAEILNRLPKGMKVYFVPGNNDLVNEDPNSINHYKQFLRGLKTKTANRAVDLTADPVALPGYTLVGLDSAGFKPQTYTDSSQESVTESTLVKADGGVCSEIPDVQADERAKAKAEEIHEVAREVSGAGPYLIFTHEPDLPDPFRSRNEQAKCTATSTWLLSQSAREEWNAKVLANQNVVGIFAGHFHSTEPEQYGGPKTNPNIKTAAGFRVGTYVALPLALRLQWKAGAGFYGMRGMSFYTVAGRTVNVQMDPYWPAGSGDECCEDRETRWVTSSRKYLKEHPDLTFVLAGVLALLLVALVLGIASGIEPPCTPFKKRWWRHPWDWLKNRVLCCKELAQKLMVEGDTNSYSLSRLQFLLWTLATIYAYTYLWMAHTWVQGLPGIPDVTVGFPWELFASGGTLVLNQVSKSAFGTKGGGPLRPQWSDLISAGGVIAPARLQFFAWTLVAVLAYLSTVLSTDPCTIMVLPDIPNRLLEISGISAVAYLAARATAAPGPVLSAAEFTPGGGKKDGTKPPPPEPKDPKGPNGGAGGLLLLAGQDLSNSATLTLFELPVAAPAETPKALPAASELPAATAPIGASAASTLPASSTAAGDQKPVGDDGEPLSPQEEKKETEKAQEPAGTDAVPDPALQYDPPPIPGKPEYAEADRPTFYTRLEVPVTQWPNVNKQYTLRVSNPDGKYAEMVVTYKEKGGK